MFRTFHFARRIPAGRTSIIQSSSAGPALIHHFRFGSLKLGGIYTLHTGNARLAKFEESLGDRLPTPYGDDMPRFRHLVNVDGDPFNWNTPVEHEQSDENEEDLEDRAKTEALNSQLFARDFEGSPENNMCDAFRRLGLVNSPDSYIPGTKIKPMPHQVIGIDWMIQQELSNQRGGIQGDDMGLGKTIQAIGTIMLNKADEEDIRRSTLILVPKGLLHQWKDEIERYRKIQWR